MAPTGIVSLVDESAGCAACEGRYRHAITAANTMIAAAIRRPMLSESTKPSLAAETNAPDRSPSDGAIRCAPPSDDSAISRSAGAEAEASTDVGDVAGVDARHDAADDRHAERTADLTGRVVDGRADAGLVARQRAHHRLGGGRHRHAHPGRHDDEVRDHQRVRASWRRSSTAARGRARSATARPSTTRLVPTRSTKRADSGATIIIVAGVRHQPDAGLERRVPVDELPVLRHQEHRPEQGEEHQRDRAAGRREARVAEHASCRASGESLCRSQQHEADRA